MKKGIMEWTNQRRSWDFSWTTDNSIPGKHTMTATNFFFLTKTTYESTPSLIKCLTLFNSADTCLQWLCIWSKYFIYEMLYIPARKLKLKTQTDFTRTKLSAWPTNLGVPSPKLINCYFTIYHYHNNIPYLQYTITIYRWFFLTKSYDN